MKKLILVLMVVGALAVCPHRVHAQGAAEYGAATSAAGSLGAKIGTTLGSALNGTSKSSTQTVLKGPPSAEPRNPSTAQKPGKSAKTGPASVNIDSTPIAAAVFVDGIPQGVTPAKLSLAKGIHAIEVRQDGYNSWRNTVLLSEGDTLAFKPALENSKSARPRFTVQR